jgi:hypothetical protein
MQPNTRCGVRELMKSILLVAASLMAGFLGGVLGTQVMRAREESHPAQVVRARSFELVDKNGRAISFWGIDRGDNVVLAFGARPEVTRYMGRSAAPGPPQAWAPLGSTI